MFPTAALELLSTHLLRVMRTAASEEAFAKSKVSHGRWLASNSLQTLPRRLQTHISRRRRRVHALAKSVCHPKPSIELEEAFASFVVSHGCYLLRVMWSASVWRRLLLDSRYPTAASHRGVGIGGLSTELLSLVHSVVSSASCSWPPAVSTVQCHPRSVVCLRHEARNDASYSIQLVYYYT